MSQSSPANNIRNQNLPFHASIMNYILKNASFDVKVKLAQVCKLFYHHYPDNIKILNELEIYTSCIPTLNEKEIRCKSVEELKKYAEKVWVTESLEINNNDIISLPSFIHGCTANYFRCFSYISINDLNFLTKAGTIKSLVVSRINDDDGNIVPFERIIDSVPNADYIHINGPNLTFNPSGRFINRKNKLKSLSIFYIEQEFNVLKFYEFLKKNLAPRARIGLKFCTMIPYWNESKSTQEWSDDAKAKYDRIANALQSKINTWKRKSEKPKLKIEFF